jgi:hypothetical protein
MPSVRYAHLSPNSDTSVSTIHSSNSSEERKITEETLEEHKYSSLVLFHDDEPFSYKAAELTLVRFLI